MTEKEEETTFKEEFDFQVALLRQVDRIGNLTANPQIFPPTDKYHPPKIQEYVSFIKQLSAYFLKTSVECLEEMLSYYLDQETKKQLEESSKRYNEDVDNERKKGYEPVASIRNFALRNFGILMRFMGKKGLLLEETAIGEIK